MGHTIDILRDKIDKLRTKSTDDRYFISQHDIHTLLTNDIIADVIAECVQEHAIPEHQEIYVTTRIANEGKIILGILIWKKWLHKLIKCIEHNVLDSQLPLENVRADEILGNIGWNFAQSVQWEFLPRMLTNDMSGVHNRFRREEILPFISEKRLGEGSFGDVFKVSVLPSLQTMFPKQTAEVFIVRKTLKTLHDTECLQILDCLRHPNIVKLLASYSHCDKHHFLFPLIPLDLAKFLERKERFGEFKNDHTFYTALEGLSSALKMVHCLNLSQKEHGVTLTRTEYHHDLRPSSVLVDSRTFYLAGFGIGELSQEEYRSRTMWKSGLEDYVAPECMDEAMRRGDVGRALDIWSLGCMISEVAAYIEGGPEGVDSFRKRRFGTAFSDRPHMKDHYFFSGQALLPEIASWIEEISVGSKCRVFHGLLDVVRLTLKINPMDRPKATTVHQRLSFLSVQATFAAVQKSLTGYFRSARDQGEVASAIRFHAARLAAWGKVLHLTERASPPDRIEATSDQGNLFRDTLTSLLRKLEPGAEEVPPVGAALPIRRPFHEELEESIDKLCNSLPAKIWGNLRNALITDSFEDQALHDIVSNTASGPDSKLVALASTALASTKLRISRLREAQSPVSRELQLSRGQLRILKPFGEGLSVGSYCGKQVFVEWVSPTAKWIKMPWVQREQRMQFKTEVFRLPWKPRAFRFLDCLGYVLPTSPTAGDYGFVWEFPGLTPGPAIQQTEIAPISLLNILQSPIKSHSKVCLPLGERFRLAYKIVRCVLEFNTVGWLNRNISSRSIVFFEQEGGASTLSEIVENPYLVNFQYSRLAENTDDTLQTEYAASNTSDPLLHYQHPNCSPSNPFREVYDYYSTGIVLLELGSWQPLDAFLDQNRHYRSDRGAFRDMLVSKYVPRLSYIMGDTYRDVTLACLRSEFGQDASRGVEGQTVIQKFYDKVVCPLGKVSRSPI